MAVRDTPRLAYRCGCSPGKVSAREVGAGKSQGRGNPSTWVAMMLRWISGVPPAIVPRSLLASGTIAPHVGAVYPLSEVAAALRLVADGRAVGKVLLTIG